MKSPSRSRCSASSSRTCACCTALASGRARISSAWAAPSRWRPSALDRSQARRRSSTVGRTTVARAEGVRSGFANGFASGVGSGVGSGVASGVASGVGSGVGSGVASAGSAGRVDTEFRTGADVDTMSPTTSFEFTFSPPAAFSYTEPSSGLRHRPEYLRPPKGAVTRRRSPCLRGTPAVRARRARRPVRARAWRGHPLP
ncbi:hypothetical protein E3T42_00605 [Cryobacterium sp. TMT4-10]|uniref:Uncharacterized protein n=1 Tax=Cryobacterium shii TaxID=1259235 RepID=A0AAQ2C4Z2_9MICO|nr:hypothetical protein E3O49_11420 [Cryobacterium shii]TFD21914.1 hypothetical protein E3T42_00605 [Cryobacterium sp. TMT4-10]